MTGDFSERPLTGRTILITGASSGVGNHLAKRLAAQGARIVCCARRLVMLRDLVASIQIEGGLAIAQTCDVSDPASIAAAFDRAEQEWGVVDSVIANAGINHAGPALRLTVDQLDSILTVNLRGAFLAAQEGARRMIDRSDPATPRRIVFISSILGLKPAGGTAIYSASKASIIMLARSLALEWARHDICVNAICPGYMPTDIVDDWFETDAGKRQIAGWPRRRLMPLSDLDPALLYLLSFESKSVTGTHLVVDDGQSLA